jgi:beta-phosphoglucomutase family hydrolase/PPOX class probable F420-dependent enzyme
MALKEGVMPLSKEEVEVFLCRPNVAVVATVGPDGQPHAVPTWYEYDGGDIVLHMGLRSRKYRNLRQNDRVSLCMDTKTAPYQAVIVYGRASLAVGTDRAGQAGAHRLLGLRAGRPAVRAVLWDLDGVLVDSARFHFQAWRELSASLGREFGETDFRRTFGLRNDAILRDLLGDLPPVEVERLAARKEELFRQAARGNIVALPGALPLLRLLRQRSFRLALVSSTPHANIDLILGSLGLETAFDIVVGEEDVTRGKPDPEGFLLAAERLGVPPGECVVIEDAPAGVEAARRGGMRCLGVHRDRPREALAQADLVVEGLEDPAVADFFSS